MKNSKQKNKIIAACLAFLMFLSNVPMTTVYSDDSLKNLHTYNDMMEYISATSELMEKYKTDFNDELSIDVAEGTIQDMDGTTYAYYDDVIEEALGKDTEEAKKLLENNGYEIIDATDSIITISDPFQTKRLIVIDDNLTTGNGAEEILHYGDEYILQYSSKQDVIDAYNKYLSDNSIDEIYIDSIVTLAEEDKDIDYDTFYPVDSEELVNGSKSHYSWGVTTMGLDVMQDNLVAAGYDLPEIIVAVLDTGCYAENKYLENRILLGYNYVDNNEDTTDNHGHGTHVSGTICDGTASNVKILPVKVLNDEGKGTLLYVRNGIYYAISEGASVINMSLSSEDTTRTSTYLETALQAAIDADCVVCVAAGNEEGDVADYYPSRSSRVFTITALGTDMVKAYYSNTGDAIDFAAPGSSIISTYQTGLAYKSGTSMATPHVSAASALLKTWDKTLTVAEIKELLIENCVDLGDPGFDTIYGYGYINLANFDVTRSCKHEYISNITKEPTCTENGVLTYTCTKCGDTYTEEIQATGHKYVPEITKATCLVDGYTTYTCSVCGDSYVSDIVKATGHTYTSAITKMATCTENGIITYTCVNGDDTYTEEIIATGHTYSSVVTKEPTHTETGIRTYTCTKCGDTYTEEIPVEEHVFVKSTVKPTCTEQGYDLYVCECGYSYKDNYTEALTHDYQVSNKVEATCTEEGYIEYTCTRCGDVQKEVISKVPHEYEKEVIPETCTENGYTIYTCKNCGDTYTSDIVPATGHTYKDIVHDVTCTENGYTEHICSVCGDSYIDNIVLSIGHQYDIVVTPATCTEDGLITYTCKNCGDTYSEVIKTPGHTFHKETVAATCTEDGYTEHVCDICGYSYKDEIITAIGHKYIDKVIAPTCTEEGYTEHTCEVCGDTYKDNIISATGHSYNTTIISPTCTEEGYTLYTCTICGDTYKDNYVEKAPHEYEAEITKQPSHYEDGEVVYTCKNCGDTYTEVIPKGDHVYTISVIPPTCQEEGYTLYECKECGYSYKDNFTEKVDHDYQVVSTIPATCTSTGLITYKCSMCGDTYTEDIQMLTHNYKEVSRIDADCTNDGKITYKCEYCGDEYSDIIPAIGHKYIEKVVDPTCQEEGYTEYTCEICGDSYKDNYVEKTDHKESEWIIDKEATCEEQGEKHTECEYCGQILQKEVIQPTGHQYTEKVVAPTSLTRGYTLHTCSICGDSYKDNYVDCTNSVVNSIYKAFDTIKSIFSSLFK